MKAIDLYKFVKENDIEYHWYYDSEVFMYVEIQHIDEWNKLLGSSIFDDDGLDCIMKEGYFVFEMQNICECFDIELSEIFKNKDVKY